MFSEFEQSTEMEWPLTDEEYLWITSNREQLVETIVESRELVSVLFVKNCISKNQFDNVKSLSSQAEINNNLIENISRKSKQTYVDFCAVLEITRQGSLAYILHHGSGLDMRF